MNNQIIMSGPHKDFETIKKVDENGGEYWTARELMPLLGYSKWQSFEKIIKKAMLASKNSGQDMDSHFIFLDGEILNYKLDRYACYLIAQNADSKKFEVARMQTYIAIQTRKREILERMSLSERLFYMTQVDEKIKREAKELAYREKKMLK